MLSINHFITNFPQTVCRWRNFQNAWVNICRRYGQKCGLLFWAAL